MNQPTIKEAKELVNVQVPRPPIPKGKWWHSWSISLRPANEAAARKASWSIVAVWMGLRKSSNTGEIILVDRDDNCETLELAIALAKSRCEKRWIRRGSRPNSNPN
jgi:hypothetical protein